MNRPYAAGTQITQGAPPVIRLALRVLLVGVICHLSTEIGFAHKIPPHYISPLWPTGAILFSVLIVTPIRHWWAYILAAYVTSVVNDARANFPISAIFFIVAGILEILIAAVGVRRLAGGLRAFDSLRSLLVYLVVAVFLAPFASAFVGALAGGAESYWFYWRAWFLSESLAYLMLAPAILSWIGAARSGPGNVSRARFTEACLIGGGLLAIAVRVFGWPAVREVGIPALVYLPLPFLLWAAVRFGPAGLNTSLLIVALLSISGTVQGHGPFATSGPAENVLALQLFLIVLSLPLMLLAALIAERRNKANVLRESEARFRSMADTAPVLVWMWGRDKLHNFFNKTWLDFTGRTLAREVGNGWLEGVHPDDLQQCVATRVSAFDARREFTMQYRLRRHDGEYRWVSDKGVPRLAADGVFLGYIGCADDISERKEAELEAQRHRAEIDEALGFERLMADVLAALLLADPRDEDRVIERGLRSMAGHLGVEGVALWERFPDRIAFRTTHRWLAENLALPPEELGVPELPWISGQLVNGSVVRFSRHTELPAEAEQDLPGLRRLGVRSLLAVPFSVSGTVAGALSFASVLEEHAWPGGLVPRVLILAEVFAGMHARRVVERRERAAQTETGQFRERLAHLIRVHTMGEMSAAIAHEINQPLMAIANYAQAARRRLADGATDTERIFDLLNKIAAQSARAGDVVKRVAAMVRRHDTEATDLDLGRLISDSVRLVDQELQLHDIRVELRVAPDLPPVRADEIQLQQVMLNLMRNAKDAMDSVPTVAGKTVTIDVAINDEGELVVRVRDRGPGIGTDELERVFEPFYSTKASGLGIGLAICRNIVEAHGGQLWASSEPGGAVFQFTLPASDSGGAS